jgi:Carboxypeptidase regulatory-like domain
MCFKIHRNHTFGILIAVVCLLTAITSLSAQTVVTGDLAGTVTDPTSAGIGNATVTAKSDATGDTHTATTNLRGEFRIPLLRPGTYTVTVAARGFELATGRANVNLGQVVTTNFQLGLATQSSQVEVSAEVSLMQTEDANLATTFDTRQLNNLPTPGNDITSYAFTAPGATVSTGGGYGNFSMFGLPGVSNLFTVNGTDYMDPYLNLNNSGASNLTLGANEIQQAAVVSNGYTGQYGRQAGAQVNYVTKSGTNDFHGNAAWYYNGRVMNANDWFNNATGTPRPFSVSNQWAASAGGRIIKNKLFFFADNEGLRYVLPGGGPVYIPTPAFSSFVLNNVRATNPAALPFYTTAMNLYGGASGAARATPVTTALDPSLGCGDFTGGGFGTTQPCAGTFRSTVNNLNTEWLLTSRVDWNPTDKDRLYFRYNMDRGVQATGTDPINPAFNANSVQPQYGGQIGYTRVVSATTVNQLLLSASYYSAIFGPPNLSAALQTFPTTWAFNDGLFSNLGGSDNVYPQGREVRQHQLIDDYSITHNNHSLKFGVNVRRNWVNSFAFGPNTSGLYTFNSMTDFVSGSLSNTGGSTFSQAFTSIGAEQVKMYSLGFYAQDEWKVRSNLSLTLTLRMDRNSNITCEAHCFNELLQPFGQISHSPATPYNTTIRTGLEQAFPEIEPIVVEPRIGFAYSLTPSTVLRGGFGIFSDLYQGLIADRFLTNSPAVASFTTTTGLVATNSSQSALASVSGSAAAFQSGFTNGATLGQLQASVPLGFTPPSFNTVANRFYNPKYYEWNFEVQQGIGRTTVLSVNYVGNHGYHELNQTLLGNAFARNGFAGLPTTAPDPRFGQIRELNNQGWSNYDGLVTSLRWRWRSQFSGTLSYTWGHSLDTCSNSCLEPFNALSAPSIRYQVSPYNLKYLNYSNSDYDVRHTVSANFVYTTPNTFHHAYMNQILGGWTVADTLLFHSGYPFSIVNSGVRSAQISNATGFANATVLATYLGTGFPACDTPNVPCYSRSQFLPTASQGNWGNIPRNSFRGPNYFDTDLSVNKAFTMHERYQVIVGANLYNILNHPNFDLPPNNLASGTFGVIQNTVSAPTSAYGSFQGSAVSGRVIQTQIKFVF